MLEIPGEEAPTDPGLQARLRLQADDAVRAKKKKRLNLLAGLLVLLLFAVVSGVGFRVQAARDAELVYELDDYYVIPDADLKSAPVVAAVVPSVTPDAPVRRPRNTVPAGGEAPPTTGPPAVVEGAVASAPTAYVPISRPKEDLTLAPIASAADGVKTTSLDFSVGRVSSAAILQNDDEIKAMARKIIDAYSPQLTTCYQSRLKQVETLKGAWKVAFTITKEGAASKVRVSPVSAPDAELEACMTRNIQSWKFQKIYDEFPLSKTYRFGAEGW